jgi:hypothetical protein
MKTTSSSFSRISFTPSRNKTTFYTGLKFNDWRYFVHEIRIHEWELDARKMDEDELELFLETFDDVLFNTDLDNLKYICTFKSKDPDRKDQDYYFVNSPAGGFHNSYIISPDDETQQLKVYRYYGLSCADDLFDIYVRGTIFNVFYSYEFWHENFRLGVSFPTFKKYIIKGGDMSELIPDEPNW